MAEVILRNNVRLTYRDQGDGADFDVDQAVDGSRITVTYKCAWEDRRAAIDGLLGNVLFQPTPVVHSDRVGYFSRILPHAHAESESAAVGRRWMFCKQATYKGYVIDETDAGEPEIPVGKFCHIRAVYEGATYDQVEDLDVGDGIDTPTAGPPAIILPVDESNMRRYVSHTSRNKSRVLSARGGTWVWVDTGALVPDATFISVRDTEHIFTWHQVPYKYIPWASIANCVNKTNAGVFGSSAVGFFAADQTLVFCDYGIKQIRLPDGTRAADISYVMDHKPYGANFFPDGDRDWRFFEVRGKTDPARRPYASATFQKLFRPIAPP